jgi:hypothetical protein
MIAPEAGLSVRRQCALLEIARSSFCYRPRPETVEELDLLKWLDRIPPTTQPPAAGGALSGGVLVAPTHPLLANYAPDWC